MTLYNEGDGSAKSSSAADQLRRPTSGHPFPKGAEAEARAGSRVTSVESKERADAAAMPMALIRPLAFSFAFPIPGPTPRPSARSQLRSPHLPSPRPLLCVRYR
mmetsp:Transcript_39532/g.81178  ORF Transcript_39532/g.81178 Transcript_39532/m.81178 type:complete len:104 (+) Transcript_39532:1930-2241(+)